MTRGKKIYFGVLILGVVLVTVFYVSYAFFTGKVEGNGKLNIVAGTLDYKIESSDLENNSIEVAKNNTKTLTIKITSLNKIDSKYELYYNLSNNLDKVEVKYINKTKDSPKGIIGKNEEKEIEVIIINNSSDSIIVEFGVHGGLTSIAYDDISKYGNKVIEKKDDLILVYNYTGNKENPKQFPKQNEGYYIKQVQCNGIIASFNNITWQLTLPSLNTNEIICNFEISDLITMNSETYLRIGDEVAGIDGSRWHVLEVSPSGSNTVTLLADNNLKSDGNYDYSCSTVSDSQVCGHSITFDPDNTNIYDESDNNNIGYFIKNTYEPKVIESLPNTTNVTLPTIEQIMLADGLSTLESGLDISHTWLLPKPSYVTRSPLDETNNVWSIYLNKYDHYRAYNSFKIRPVITTPKTNLIAR